MPGTWRARLDELETLVGSGTLEGQIIVNQAYAAYQEVHEHLNHPRGGIPHYVGSSLLARQNHYVNNLADGVLTGQLVAKMVENMEDMSDQVLLNAPVLYTPLRNSGHPAVRDDGHVVYDRAPHAGRVHT